MFTGIIREIGKVTAIQRRTPWLIWIAGREILDGLHIGDSIAVAGACLTVVEIKNNAFAVEATDETLKRTRLQTVKVTERINLEPALSASGKFDGHIVQGHVDGTGRVLSVTGSGVTTLTIKPEKHPGAQIVVKGSITIDGVSLTVTDYQPSGAFSTVLIPITREKTTLGRIRPGQIVNLEYDIIGKYIAQNLRF